MTTGRLRIRVRVAVLVAAAYWLFMLVVTHLPQQPGRTLRLMHGDKLLHFAAYTLLAFLLACALRRLAGSPKSLYLLVLIVVATYGALDESMQAFVPSRTPDALDWLADLAGAAAGIGLHALFVFFVAPLRNTKKISTH